VQRLMEGYYFRVLEECSGILNLVCARIGGVIDTGTLPTRANRNRECGAKAGGARRDRTADLLHAMQALSQLSYGPVSSGIRYHSSVIGIKRSGKGPI
jgi:hypothetical protein